MVRILLAFCCFNSSLNGVRVHRLGLAALYKVHSFPHDGGRVQNSAGHFLHSALLCTQPDNYFKNQPHHNYNCTCAIENVCQTALGMISLEPGRSVFSRRCLDCRCEIGQVSALAVATHALLLKQNLHL